MIGHVKWFSHASGFGFITPLDGKAQGKYFVYRNEDVYFTDLDIVSPVKHVIDEGVKVQFDLEEQDNGLRARNVEAV